MLAFQFFLHHRKKIVADALKRRWLPGSAGNLPKQKHNEVLLLKLVKLLSLLLLLLLTSSLFLFFLTLLAELLSSRYRYSHWGCRSCGISSLSYHVGIAYTAGVVSAGVVNLLGNDVGTTTAFIAFFVPIV